MLLRYRFRIYLLGLLVIACFSLLLVRLWSIQITRGEEFKARVPSIKKKTARVPGVRGEIRDIHGKVLVENDLTYELVLNFKEIIEFYEETRGPAPKASFTRQTPQGRKETSTEPDIAKIINTSVVPVLQKYTDELEPFNAAQMQAHWRGTRGAGSVQLPDGADLRAVRRLRRAQPRPTRRDAERAPETPLSLRGRWRPTCSASCAMPMSRTPVRTTSKTMTTTCPMTSAARGLEKTMDEYLRGTPGSRELLFDEKGRFVGEVGYTPPTSGGGCLPDDRCRYPVRDRDGDAQDHPRGRGGDRSEDRQYPRDGFGALVQPAEIYPRDRRAGVAGLQER